METKSSAGSGTLVALSNDLVSAVEHAGRAVVAIDARKRVPSSGVLWRPGVVVSADHTIERDEEITVRLPDASTVPAELAGRDSGTDLAVLRLKAKHNTAEIGDASTLKVGHLVLAVGRVGESGVSASLGVVSALGGSWRTWRGGQLDQFIRLDIAIYLGFSGGPLVDTQGRIVGINTSGLRRSMGVTIPSSTVDRVADELLEKGRIARGYVGLGMQPVRLQDSVASKLNLGSKGGMIVVTVEPEGPAGRAGALIGDVVVALGGKPVSDIDDVQAWLGSERVGKPLKASLIRGGQLVEITIVVGERPTREE